MATDHDHSIGTKSARRRAKYLARQNRELIAQLVQIRKDAGLKQSDVAELLGHTQQAVSEFERMLTAASLSRISNYAHAVGALVTHYVAKDSGQLEAHGDRWIQFVELPPVQHKVLSGHEFVKALYEPIVTETAFQDQLVSGSAKFTKFSVTFASNSPRTDFALAG
ncbi:helix-turn-helix domain-containing protein [Arthrobacter sp. RAF14]|uniref:helix-turn-helix domain-containing protein n=1 Tax=Arthrobacter sp. RAF14 TaxID=3233051 RepID=UPI003F920469